LCFYLPLEFFVQTFDAFVARADVHSLASSRLSRR
jgi:hypothetical protein